MDLKNLNAATKKSLCHYNPRLVGDPVDVVTGANTDVAADFRLLGPLPMRWLRYYDSAQSATAGPLGWGHSHDLERFLYRDLEGVRYEDPAGSIVGFPDLAIGDNTAAGGLFLTRVREDIYCVAQPGQPNHEFEFPRDSDRGRLVRFRRGNQTVEFRYSDSGTLKEIIDSRGRLIRVGTDDAGRLAHLALVDPASGVVGQKLMTYEYDNAGNLVSGTDLYRTTVTFFYDAANRMTRRTDRKGYSFHFEYDEQGRCIHSRGDDGLFEVFLEYHPGAKKTIVRRGDGGVWVYTYTESSAISQIIDPYGGVTSYVPDDLGRTAQEIDPNGNVTQLHYNWLGQHDFRIDPQGYVLPTKEADSDPPDPLAYRLPETPLQWEFGNLVISKEWKPPNRNDSLLSGFPASVCNAVFSTADPKWQTIPSESASDLTSEIADKRPLEDSTPGFTELRKYDANGNLIEHRDRDGRVSRATFGSWNALGQAVDALGNVTTFQQTAQGGLVAEVTDPGGTTTKYIYDLKDLLVEVGQCGGNRELLIRDRAGNIVEKRNGEGRTLVKWEVGPGNLDKVRVQASGEKHFFEYDKRGRTIRAEAPAGVATFAYTDDDKILTDQRDGTGIVHEFNAGELVSTCYFEKFKVTYSTDDCGHLKIQDPTGAKHHFKFGESGLIAKLFANGSKELYRFDAEGRCLFKAQVRRTSPPTLGPRLNTFTYSPAGDLLVFDDNNRGITKYFYDAAHRLTEEMLPDGVRRRFAFDTAGNLLVQPGLADVEMGPGNQLWKANSDRFTYNDRGHLCFRDGPQGTTRYEYNDLDMLVRCEIQGEFWTASYDAYCRRIEKTWRGRKTTYYWDKFRLAAELSQEGSIRIYIYADEIALVPFLFIEYDGLDTSPASGKRHYVWTDQIGTPVRVEDDLGQVCWSARIDPYGLANISPQSTLEMPLRFPGHLYDSETGLHYNRFRYYSPELARYLQSDPAGQEGGINLYGYSADPLTEADIDGLAKSGPAPSKPRASGPKAGKAPSGAGAGCPLRPAETKPFEGVGPIKGQTVGAIRSDLRAAGFKREKGSGSSEVWSRTRLDRSKETVRIDAKGHPSKPDKGYLPKATTTAPHGHKELQTAGGQNVRCDDYGNPIREGPKKPTTAAEAQQTKDAHQEAHIPIKG